LRAVAYRLLGSPSEAEDAVQDAWLRVCLRGAGEGGTASHSSTEPPERVWVPGGKPRVVFAFTITGGTIVAIDLIADPTRLGQLDLALLKD
jgi:hypothetical protein